jgi:cytidylate kinase
MEHDMKEKNNTLKPYTIAIDGPTGAGKSTLAREIAKRRALTYIDTGAMYRAIGLYVLCRGIHSEDVGSIIQLLPEIELSITHKEDGQHIYLNGEDVSDEIRTPEASIYASNVSKIPEVRAFLLNAQRQLAAQGNTVMDGRDIGTVILPDAEVKIFLTASPEVRALRRHNELIAKGMQSTYEDVLEDLIWRDKNDSTRSTAPLKQAEDAVVLDTTGLDFEEAVAKADEIITSKLSGRK